MVRLVFLMVHFCSIGFAQNLDSIKNWSLEGRVSQVEVLKLLNEEASIHSVRTESKVCGGKIRFPELTNFYEISNSLFMDFRFEMTVPLNYCRLVVYRTCIATLFVDGKSKISIKSFECD